MESKRRRLSEAEGGAIPAITVALEDIRREIETAANEGRDFTIPVPHKLALIAAHGLDEVCSAVVAAIRSTNTQVIEPPSADPSSADALPSLVDRVLKEASGMGELAAWGYKEGPSTIECRASPLLSVSSSGSMLSTHLNGHARYNQRVIAKTPTPAENWNNDKVLTAAVRYVCADKVKRTSDALSRNRLRVFCMQGNGCHYPTAFPISVVVYLLRREAARRPSGRITRFLDPCAGWGDRLAGAMLSGVVDEYHGIDPWDVSNSTCEGVCAALRPRSNLTVNLYQRGAQDESAQWPDAELVFTSPPYAGLECYGVDSKAADSQAWRLCQSGRFVTHFLAPMLRNAARCTKALRGRVIINIGNTPKNKGGEYLTRDVVRAAEAAGLVLVETLGMRLSVRAPKTSHEHGAEVVRGEPFFVFEHPSQVTAEEAGGLA